MKITTFYLLLLIATVAAAQTATLTWVQSNSSGVSTNNIYRAGISGGPYSEIVTGSAPTTKYVDTTVQNGQTYCWVVTAVANGVESHYSNEACETVTTQAPSELKAK